MGPSKEAAQSIVQAIVTDIRSLFSKVHQADKTSPTEIWFDRGQKLLAFTIFLAANATGLPVGISVYHMIA